mmetsp:Transcript_12892/g.38943  ORF Transcript_12892/g.38943 Transcript_12892/m.38943 type:complete len:1018 (-) Transcript_12892:2774-5827(-)
MLSSSCSPLAAVPVTLHHSKTCLVNAAMRQFAGMLRGRPLSLQAMRCQRMRLPGCHRRSCRAMAFACLPEGGNPHKRGVQRRSDDPEGLPAVWQVSEEALLAQAQQENRKSPHWFRAVPRLLGAVAISLIASARFAQPARADDSVRPAPTSLSQWAAAPAQSCTADREHAVAVDRTAPVWIASRTHAPYDGSSSSAGMPSSFRQARHTGIDLAAKHETNEDTPEGAETSAKGSRAERNFIPPPAPEPTREELVKTMSRKPDAMEKYTRAMKMKEKSNEFLENNFKTLQALGVAEKKDLLYQGFVVNPKDMVPDPDDVPIKESDLKGFKKPMSAWRPDLLRDMTYTQFWTLVQHRMVEKVRYTFDSRSVIVTTKETAPGGARTEKVGLPFDPDLYNHLVTHGVYIIDPPFMNFEYILPGLIKLIIPLTIGVWIFAWADNVDKPRKMSRREWRSTKEGQRKYDTTFDDLAGVDQIKEEIQMIVKFLTDPADFFKAGARAPAGILLCGPPGTGKTLMAKAIAGESGVPLLAYNSTDFDVIVGGVGAKRVRAVFDEARKLAPCVVFIDEFDGIGQKRGDQVDEFRENPGENDSVINTFLTEMDGFDSNSGVVVMAATNRLESLDKALIRPGRFDRVINMLKANTAGRYDQLLVHARGKNIQEPVDWMRIARSTHGFSAAEIMNLLREAAVYTTRQGRDIITEDDIFETLERILYEHNRPAGALNDGRTTTMVPKSVRRAVAVKQAAIALIAYVTPEYDEVSKIICCPGSEMRGQTMFTPNEEHLEASVTTRGFMESKLVVTLAGRCAERLLLGDAHMTQSGAIDLDDANYLARRMVYTLGWSQKLGPICLTDSRKKGVYGDTLRRYGEESLGQVADISPELAMTAMGECEDLLLAAEAKAFYGLGRNWDALTALVLALEEKEKINRKEFEEIMTTHNVRKFVSPFLIGFTFNPDTGDLVIPDFAQNDWDSEEIRQSMRDKAYASKDDDIPGPLVDEMSPLMPYRVAYNAPHILASSIELRM